MALRCSGSDLLHDHGLSSAIGHPILVSEEKDTLSVAGILERYGDVITALPDHPRSQEVMALLLDAARAESFRGSNEDPHEALIRRFSDHNIGLYAFHRKYADEAEHSTGRAVEYARAIRTRLPDTAVAALALDNELKYLADQGEDDRFLRLCSDALETGLDRKEQKTVLIRRAEFYRAKGNRRAAVLDQLRLWSSFPEALDESRLRSSITAILGQAGFVLEADLASNPEDADPPVAWWLKEFERAARLPIGESHDGPISHSAAYFHLAPNIDSILEAAAGAEATPIEEAMFTVRLGRLAAAQREFERSLEFYGAYVETAKEILESPETSEQSLELLKFYSKAAYDNSRRLYGKSKVLRELRARRGISIDLAKGRRISSSLDGLLEEAQLQLSQKAADRGDREYAEALEELVAYYKSRENRRGVIEAYQSFSDRFADSPLAPDYLMKTAEFYRQEWNTPAMAAVALEKVIQRYPDSVHVPTARLRRGLYLYESERFGEALLAFQEYLADPPPQNGEQVATVKFLSALCEAGLGMEVESERHMTDLIADHAASPLAPRALLWLASNRLARQDYSGARRHYQEVVEKYPNSPYANQSADYLKRLSRIDNGSSQ